MGLRRTCTVNPAHGRMDWRYVHWHDGPRRECCALFACPVCFHWLPIPFDCTADDAWCLAHPEGLGNVL